VTVWIVSTEQLLAWVQNPVPLSQLNSLDALKCSTPQISQNICDGIPANEQGLLDRCDFSDFPFFTCVSPGKPLLRLLHFSEDITQYGCPVDEPSPSNPNPQQDTSNGQAPRYRRKSYYTAHNLCLSRS
jgi:hypothetical protein